MTRGKKAQRKAAQAKRASDKEKHQKELIRDDRWHEKQAVKIAALERESVTTIRSRLQSRGMEMKGNKILYRNQSFDYQLIPRAMIRVDTNYDNSCFSINSDSLGGEIAEFLDSEIDQPRIRRSSFWSPWHGPEYI